MDEKKDFYSTLGLTFGILSMVFLGNFLFSILGIVFSSISKRNFTSNGKAQAGLILSIISIILSSILVVVLMFLYLFKYFQIF